MPNRLKWQAADVVALRRRAMELVCQLPEDFEKARYVLNYARDEHERRLNPDRVDDLECGAMRDGNIVPIEIARKPTG